MAARTGLLLPDPVEKTEWVVETREVNGQTPWEDYVGNKQQAVETLRERDNRHPYFKHTLKSITTIEKTIKVVKPK